MSASATDCQCACPDPVITEIPGVEGASGDNGLPAYTLTTADFVVPPLGSNVAVTVESVEWLGGDPSLGPVEGAYVLIPTAGYFTVLSFAGSTIVLTYLDITQNTHVGETIPAGRPVLPTGPQLVAGAMTGLTSLAGGTGSTTLAAATGVHTLAFYIDATAIANGDLITEYVPGYNFKLLKFDARCAAPVTTGAKASTLNLEINTTDVIGGVISLAGTYAQGAAQAGTAITNQNTGTLSQSFSIEASSTTAFVEGAFWLIISIQNMDDANAWQSVALKVNEIITEVT